MRKRKLRVKPNHLLTFATLLLIIIGYACRKHFTNNDNFNYTKLYNEFFDVSGVSNPTVLDIVANVKQQEARMHFAQSFVQRDGYLYWDKAVVLHNSGHSIALLPFAKKGASEITGYIQAQKLANNKGYSFEFFRTANLPSYNFSTATISRANGHNIHSVLNYFNYKLFNKRSFSIAHANEIPAAVLSKLKNKEDWRKLKGIITNDTAVVNQVQHNTAVETNIVPGCPEGMHVEWILVGMDDEYYYYQGRCINGAAEPVSTISPSSGGSNNLMYWWWANTGGGGQSSIGGDPGVGGGSGGGIPGNSNCVYTPISTNNNVQPVTTIEPVNYYGGDPGGWQQCNNQEPVYNPNIADNVIIDTSITNNFPCVVPLLDTIATYGNLNQQAQVALSTIFGVNTYMHLTIQLGLDLVGSTTGADTRADVYSLPQVLIDNHHFAARIRLNPDMLRKSAKEFIIGTLVHEAMHAYIDYVFYQYRQGLLDSNAVKNMFPIFWGSFNRNPSSLQHHSLMAQNWTDKIKQSLYVFTNNDMDSTAKNTVYDALSWGGLSMTEVFNAKSDKCMIEAINHAAWDKNLIAPFTITSGLLCRDTFNFTLQTLKLKRLCE